MENKINWITELANKKPSPALVAALLIAVSALSAVIVKQHSDLLGKDREKAVALQQKDTVIAQNARAFGTIIARQNTEILSCRDLVVQRTDAVLKQTREDYENRLREQKEIDVKRDRLNAERKRLLEKNSAKLNTIQTVTNQKNDEN